MKKKNLLILILLFNTSLFSQQKELSKNIPPIILKTEPIDKIVKINNFNLTPIELKKQILSLPKILIPIKLEKPINKLNKIFELIASKLTPSIIVITNMNILNEKKIIPINKNKEIQSIPYISMDIQEKNVKQEAIITNTTEKKSKNIDSFQSLQDEITEDDLYKEDTEDLREEIETNLSNNKTNSMDLVYENRNIKKITNNKTTNLSETSSDEISEDQKEFNIALKLYKEKAYGPAIEKLNEYISGNGEKFLEAKTLIARILKIQKKFNESKAVFQEVLNMGSDTPLAPYALFNIAVLNTHFNEDQAIGKFYLLTEKYPEDRLVPEALFRISEIYIKRKNYPEALNVLLDIISKYNKSMQVPDAYFLMGNIFESKGFKNYDRALQCYKYAALYKNSKFYNAAVVKIKYLSENLTSGGSNGF